MVVRVAINGFGRLGRIIFRAIRQYYRHEIVVVAVNDACDIKSNVHLLCYDSAHKRFPEQLTIVDENHFEVGTGADKWVVQNIMTNGRELTKNGPSKLPWAELNVDIAIEATGVFRSHSQKDADGNVTKEGYDGHLAAGAKKVIVPVVPTDQIESFIVLGSNDEDLKADTNIVSLGSCSTTCLAPVIKLLNDAFSITDGFVTTVHSYTTDQVVTDVMHKDLRRARAAASSIIPTSTGITTCLKRVVKNLTRGCMNALALRVPTITGSLVDITVNVHQDVTREQVNQIFHDAAATEQLHSIISYTEEPIVSSDIVDDPHSAIIDGLSTMVLPNQSGALVKVLAWYDNEWMYACRCADLINKLAQFIQ